MKIIKAILNGVKITPKHNQPYFTEKIWIQHITHFYDDGGHDAYCDNLFGNGVEPEFFTILDDDCEVILDLKEVECNEKFYILNDWKNACFNRTQENPYQLPDWKTIK